MSNALTDFEKDATEPGSMSEEKSQGIQSAVREIFQSVPFRASRQSQELLRYIVMHTVAGQDHLLRERVIGMEVFARKPDYDTGDDPVVRLRASELRKRLAQFYQSSAGQSSPVQISIPSGSYRANFTWQEPSSKRSAQLGTAPQMPVVTVPQGAVALPGDVIVPSLRPRRILFWMASTVLAVCLAGGFLYWRNFTASPLNQFWGPLMEDPHPALVCMGSNAVYRLSNQFLEDYQRRTGVAHDGIEFLIKPVPGEKMDQGDLLSANSFVALGDVAAASKFVSFLSRHGKSFSERFPNDMSFAEIQEYSSVLIGGFNNQMALTMTKDLPYVMKGSNRIMERTNPQHHWQLQFNGDARESEDYALISRLVDPATQHEVVIFGGIGQYGTQAAADFLTDPIAMKTWANEMPKGWNRKSLQIVLHVKIIDFRPVKSEVLATRIW